MKNLQKIKKYKEIRRKTKTRAKILGTAKRPRLSVFRSLKHIYVQFIDDKNQKTLQATSDFEIKKTKGKKTDIAFEVGKLAAKKALEAGIKEVVFYRAASKYHGRVKAVADGAREAGLKF